MKISVYELHKLKTYTFITILAKYHDKWLFIKYKNKSTWENINGVIEMYEKPIDTAKRELREKTGALEFTIKPIFDIWIANNDTESNGMVFFADISVLGKLPESEIEKVGQFSSLPICLTYPETAKILLDEYKKYSVKENIKEQYAK